MNVEERTRALFALVDEYRAAKTGEILGAARAEARTLAAHAFRLARGRVHEAIVDARKRYDAAIAGAEAQLRTRRRLAHQRREAAMLAEAWRHLPATLAARWRTIAGRRRWAQAHLDSALTRLPRAEWEIAHAPGWPDDERQAIAAWLAAHGGPGLLFEEDRTLAAGFRVRVGRNTLDATLQGLLADRKSIEGRLLQHLARETGEQS